MIKRLLSILLFASSLAWSQVSVAPMPVPRIQFLSQSGAPLAYGHVYTYACGGSTPLSTYTDYTGGSSNTNPVDLDAGGFAGIWLGPSCYKFIVKNAADVTQWTVDGVISPTGILTIAALTVTGNVNITGTLSVTGNSSLACAEEFGKIRYAHCFTGADAGAKITAAQAALPSTGGVVDARGFEGAQAFSSTVVLNKPITLLLGAAQITGPVSGPVIRVDSSKVVIRGVGRGDYGDANGTVIMPQASANSHGIHFTSTGDGHRYGSVRDLNIENTGAGRTGGVGIYYEAAVSPGSNAIANVERVTVRGMYDGVYLNRPITSTLLQVRSENSVNDGFVLQGNGTSVSFINTYANASGRYGYLQRGGAYISYINTAADSSVSHNYRIERLNGTSGGAAAGISMIGVGSESAGADGISILDAAGLFIGGSAVDSAVSDGIHLDGVEYATLTGNSIDQSGAWGILVTDSATPRTASNLYTYGNIYSANVSGNLSDSVAAVNMQDGQLSNQSAANASGEPVIFNQAVPQLFAADESLYLGLARFSAGYSYALINSETAGAGIALRTNSSDRVLIENSGQISMGVSGTRITIDTSGNLLPFATGKTLGNSTNQWRVYDEVVATGSLPAAGASMDGVLIIEDAGAGDRNLIIYAGGQRFRIDGGTAF